MKKYFLKRILISVVTWFIILTLIFVLVRIMPGNPFSDTHMSAEQIAAKRASMGLDDPVFVQLFRYLKGLLHGDLGSGTMLYNGVPIKAVLKVSLVNSLKIGGVAVLIGVIAGMLLGILAAVYKGTIIDHICGFLSILGICLPSYIFLIYLQQLLVYKWNLLPAFFDTTRWGSSVILPAVSMSLFSTSTILKFTRGQVIEVMNSDFIKLVKAKGVSGPKLVFGHVLRNALVPIVTVIAPLAVDLLSGATIIEKIYGINGIGKLMVDAISGAGVDYNYVLVLGMIYTTMYIVVMLLLDVLYGIIDPRIRVTGQEG